MKNIRMKLLAASLVLGAVSPAAFASDGTITFTGRITGQTCTITGNGAAADFTVPLPTVGTGTLNADGNTAGRTPFNIQLSACNPNTGNVAVFFESGANADMATGRLRNAAVNVPAEGDNPAVNAATNVQVGVLNADLTPVAIGNAYAAQNSQSVALAAGAATLQYYAQYVATGGAATAGPITTTTQYSIVYP